MMTLPVRGSDEPKTTHGRDPAQRTGSRPVLTAFRETRNPAKVKDAISDLKIFARFYKVTIDNVEDLLFGPGSSRDKAQDLVTRYRDHMRESGLAWGTVNRRLAAVRTFSRLARLLNVVAWEIDVSTGVDGRRRRDTRGISQSAAQQIERMSGDSDQVRRDRAIVILAGCLELNRAEVAGLDLVDYRPHHAAPRVTVAGVVYPLAPEVKAVLDSWIEARGFEPGALFTTLDGKCQRLEADDILPLVRPGTIGS